MADSPDAPPEKPPTDEVPPEAPEGPPPAPEGAPPPEGSEVPGAPPDTGAPAIPGAPDTPGDSAVPGAPAPPGAPGARPPASVVPHQPYYLPIIILTGVFGGLFIILPLFIKKGPNRGIIRCGIMLTLFCVWIFWVTIYISQLNPLAGPRMRNTTLAWIAYKYGNPVKSVPPSSDIEQMEVI